MQQNLWIDRNTRLILISFTVFNGNLDYFSVVRMAIEFPVSGACILALTILKAYIGGLAIRLQSRHNNRRGNHLIYNIVQLHQFS